MLNITQDGGEVLIELDATANGWKGGEDADGIIYAAAADRVAKFGPELERLGTRHAAAIEAGRVAERRIAECRRERTVARSRLFGDALTSRLSELDAGIDSAEDAKADARGEASAVIAEIENVRERIATECGAAIRKTIRAKVPAIQSARDAAAARLRGAVEEILTAYLRASASLKAFRLTTSEAETVIRQAMQSGCPALFGDGGVVPCESPRESLGFDPQTVATITATDSADDWMESESERMEGTANARNWRGMR